VAEREEALHGAELAATRSDRSAIFLLLLASKSSAVSHMAFCLGSVIASIPPRNPG
jgi:hypothetical protein